MAEVGRIIGSRDHDHHVSIVPGPGSRGGRAATGGGGAAELEAVRPLVQTISTLDTGSQVITSSQSQHGSKWILDLDDAY